MTLAPEIEMKVNGLVSWFGAKRTLAPRIIQQIGTHCSYWEPFCGSMAVLLAKPRCRMETVNDLHGDLINLARVIQGPEGTKLYRRLRRVMLHEDFLQDAKAHLAEPFAEDIERAFWYFVASWTIRNGTAGTKDHNQNFCRRFTSDGGAPGTRIASAVDSIPAWRRRFRMVQILRMDAFDMLERIEDKVGAVIYCDPPYLKKGAEYVHDFAPEDRPASLLDSQKAPTHSSLAEILRNFKKTRVLVSYYDDPRLDRLYPGWIKLDFATNKNLCAMSRRGVGGSVTAPEVLLLNGPSYAEATP